MSVIAAFTREQAAKVANVSERRASYWARHGVLVPSVSFDLSNIPHRYVYSFADVVGLRTLGMLRDQFGLSLQQLRKVQPYLLDQSDRPWSSLRLWVRGPELLFTDPATGHVVSTVHQGQAAIPVEIEQVAQLVRQEAHRLSQRQGIDAGQTERHRNVQGNRLVVAGTRVPVESILSLSEDGYGPGDIVRAFPSLSLEDVQAVLHENRQFAVA